MMFNIAGDELKRDTTICSKKVQEQKKEVNSSRIYPDESNQTLQHLSTTKTEKNNRTPEPNRRDEVIFDPAFGNIFEIISRLGRKYFLYFSRYHMLHHLTFHLIRFFSKFEKGLYKKVRRNGFIWLLDFHSGIARSVYFTGVFEEGSTYLVETIIQKGDIVIDVGANIGYYTLLFSKQVGSTGHVYAFEPVTRFYNQLTKHVEINNISNVVTERMGLSNKTDLQTIAFNPTSGSFVLQSNDRSSERVHTITLDDYVANKNIKRIDFIKTDTDGFEIQVLEGAKKTIDKYIPILLVEFNGRALKAGEKSIEQLIDLLEQYGYTFYSSYTGRKLTRAELLAEYSDRLRFSSGMNVLCKP